MTITELTKKLCAIEGLKSEVKYGDMKEILGILADLIYRDEIAPMKNQVVANLTKLGKSRLMRKLTKI